MRETRLYGSEGGEAKAFPTPIQERGLLLSPLKRGAGGVLRAFLHTHLSFD